MSRPRWCGAWSYDSGRTGLPTGLYGIAEVAITLSDPALRYPQDSDAGAVAEEIDYTEAAWSSRRPREGLIPRAGPSLSADSVYELTSLCPKRPAWLDVPAQRTSPPAGGNVAPRSALELLREVERMRTKP